ncbi:hypothetical protein F2P81_016854 [Scophthalmus maximus]|uniref:Uncharacterized protein n=1 Tax=Scophthalmus maximus TaxID=52904 RepID=A0A6A4S6T7_SCOMX|nr:hypothetical protein F2P81_016854 [Scophthalmus maximus]
MAAISTASETQLDSTRFPVPSLLYSLATDRTDVPPPDFSAAALFHDFLDHIWVGFQSVMGPELKQTPSFGQGFVLFCHEHSQLSRPHYFGTPNEDAAPTSPLNSGNGKNGKDVVKARVLRLNPENERYFSEQVSGIQRTAQEAALMSCEREQLY